MPVPAPMDQEYRAEKPLDESFSAHLGLGAVISKTPSTAPSTDTRMPRVMDRPASAIQAGSKPFHRVDQEKSAIPAHLFLGTSGRPGTMPSLSTVDRIVVNDVLEQYKPSDESLANMSLSYDEREAVRQSLSVPTPGPTSDVSLDGPPPPPQADVKVTHISNFRSDSPTREYAWKHPNEAPVSSTTEPTTEPAPVLPNVAPSRSFGYSMDLLDLAPRADQSLLEGLGIDTGVPQQPGMYDMSREYAPSMTTMRTTAHDDDVLTEAPQGVVQEEEMVDVDALLAEDSMAMEDGTDLVDQLLEEDGLANVPDAPTTGIGRSATMRRIVSNKSPESAPLPSLPTPDLPTLPSWSPILIDNLDKDTDTAPAPRRRAVELPPRTVRPHITRDAIRARMERQYESPAKPSVGARRSATSLRSPLTQMASELQTKASQATTSAQTVPHTLSKELQRQSTWFGDGSMTSAAGVSQTGSVQAAHEVPGTSEDGSDVFLSPASHAEPTLDETQEDTTAPAPQADESNGPETAFGNVLDRELRRIVRESDQKYRIHERGVYVDMMPYEQPYAGHKAWKRVQQPNEVATLARTSLASTRAPEAHGMYTTGRLFLAMDSYLPPSSVPVYPDSTFSCILDNGIHRVKTASMPLHRAKDGASPIDQEFELLESPNFAITLTFMLDQVRAESEGAPSELGGLSGEARSGVGKFFSKHLGTRSSKLKTGTAGLGAPRSTTPRTPYLGQVKVVLDEVRAQCYTKRLSMAMPVLDVEATRTNRWTSSKSRGTLHIHLFYLPPVPKSLEGTLPGNIDEAVQGMNAVAWRNTSTTYEGTLTQLGGDCSSWRRRPMRIVGLNLICYNEVTRRPTTRIDLVQALSVEPCGQSAGARDSEDVCAMPHSFCLTFRDGEKIYLYADTELQCREWMYVLQNIVMHKLTPPPPWALAAEDAVKGPAAGSSSGPSPKPPAAEAPLPTGTAMQAPKASVTPAPPATTQMPSPGAPAMGEPGPAAPRPSSQQQRASFTNPASQPMQPSMTQRTSTSQYTNPSRPSQQSQQTQQSKHSFFSHLTNPLPGKRGAKARRRAQAQAQAQAETQASSALEEPPQRWSTSQPRTSAALSRDMNRPASQDSTVSPPASSMQPAPWPTDTATFSQAAWHPYAQAQTQTPAQGAYDMPYYDQEMTQHADDPQYAQAHYDANAYTYEQNAELFAQPSQSYFDPAIMPTAGDVPQPPYTSHAATTQPQAYYAPETYEAPMPRPVSVEEMPSSHSFSSVTRIAPGSNIPAETSFGAESVPTPPPKSPAKMPQNFAAMNEATGAQPSSWYDPAAQAPPASTTKRRARDTAQRLFGLRRRK